ncbi:MAG: lipid-A-disaccharide synthase [Phycisphaerales bacterium]|nr:lipid-A-disaccharide synthase [Phycisphaerales bacterium]
MAKRVFITAAEVSGDLHASHLIRSLQELDAGLIIEGHGGPQMRAAGATIHTETTANAAMGFSALARVKEMFALLKWTREHFRKAPPDLQICVDSPALNFHFAKAAHAVGTPVLYYVAPQLWAWREGRMKKVVKWVDKVACILPFEEAYYRSHGVDATFVGHPLFDELEEPAGEARPVRAFGDAPIVGLLAGSRRSEAARNFPRMLEVAAAIRKRFANTRFLLPTTAATDPIVRGHLEGLADGLAFEIRQGAFDEFVPRCDLVMTVSGTATLHVALHNTPMIVVYYGRPLTWNAVGRWLIKTRTYALVNLLAADGALASSGRVTPAMHIVPEFVPWYGSTSPAAEHAVSLLSNPAELASQRERLAGLARKLERPGASMAVARMALGMLEQRVTAKSL